MDQQLRSSKHRGFKLRYFVFIALVSILFGCASAQVYPRMEMGNTDWPDEYQSVLVEKLNDEFRRLPDSRDSVDELLQLLVAYRKFREVYGKDNRVDRRLRAIENGLFFWDSEMELRGLALNPGEPILVADALRDPDARFRYSRRGRYHMIQFASIRRFKGGGVAGNGIPNISGPILSRDIPANIKMASREEIESVDREIAARQRAKARDNMIAKGVAVAGGIGLVALVGWLARNDTSSGSGSSTYSSDSSSIFYSKTDCKVIVRQLKGDNQNPYSCDSKDCKVIVRQLKGDNQNPYSCDSDDCKIIVRQLKGDNQNPYSCNSEDCKVMVRQLKGENQNPYSCKSNNCKIFIRQLKGDNQNPYSCE